MKKCNPLNLTTGIAGFDEDEFMRDTSKLIRIDPITKAFISGNKEEFDKNYIQKEDGHWEHKNKESLDKVMKEIKKRIEEK